MLSLVLFIWGNDLLCLDGQLALSGDNRHRRQYEHYTEGSYRVLLSRGRSGLVIKCDDGETFESLQSCGMRIIQ
ncbi:hypothetical protein VCRA2120O333_10533 [Vibrio crassostreae]|nr:hypothetical protein VCRA2113O322_20560 [Vibrio crassostreae]CAK2021781.1 hypothetical protein VCRA2113O326_20256 [Vibrio crassostreae]CAK2483967.1 hypothetical protein VCRA2114E327_30537 [Vibrio crassostreae]CAK2844558.1 hypothetical protein VCRA2113O323_30038 [Vibrio crassostreae]CAK2889563.1 hypothetical protein VCRA2113O325_30038 [Vibrio crassostreae]